MSDLLDLKGRNALVTGAGQGIGYRIALHLADHGAGTVAVNDLFEERAEGTCAAIRKTRGKAEPAIFDIGDWDAVRDASEQLRRAVGEIDVLVNNAGLPPDSASGGKPFLETTPADWAPWFQVNVFGTMNVTRSLLPGMVERGRGRVISMISDAGRVGEPGMVDYGAAKAAMAGFTRSLAKEVGRSGVTVNCIALGGVKTETVMALLTPEIEKKAIRQYPLRRLGQPEDAANMVLFLASDAADWITGQTYPVNGGYSFAM